LQAARLKYDTFLDYYLAESHLECHRGHLRVGEEYVKVLTLKEPSAHTFPLLLKGLLDVRANYHVVTEWKKEEPGKTRRGIQARERLARGPGNLVVALGLRRDHDGVDLTRGPLWLSDLPPQRFGRAMLAGPRIGIRHGVERRWRFWLEGHPCVSGPPGRGGVRATPLRQFTVDTPAGRS